MPDFSALENAQQKATVLKALIANNALFAGDRVGQHQYGNVNNVTNAPSVDAIRQVRNLLSARGLLDGLGLNVIAGITDEQLVAIYNGGNPNVGFEIGSKDDLNREFGYLRQEMKASRELDAITDPIKFLKDEQADMLRINNDTLKHYNDSFNFYLNRGFSKDQAHDKAKSAASSYRNKLLDQHNTDFKAGELAKAKNSIQVTKQAN